MFGGVRDAYWRPEAGVSRAVMRTPPPSPLRKPERRNLARLLDRRSGSDRVLVAGAQHPKQNRLQERRGGSSTRTRQRGRSGVVGA
jgi:hypothetical protein